MKSAGDDVTVFVGRHAGGGGGMIVSWSTKHLARPWLVERVTRSCTGPVAISLPVRHQGGRERKREGVGRRSQVPLGKARV